jgi:hypothetical protein
MRQHQAARVDHTKYTGWADSPAARQPGVTPRAAPVCAPGATWARPASRCSRRAQFSQALGAAPEACHRCTRRENGTCCRDAQHSSVETQCCCLDQAPLLPAPRTPLSTPGQRRGVQRMSTEQLWNNARSAAREAAGQP